MLLILRGAAPTIVGHSVAQDTDRASAPVWTGRFSGVHTAQNTSDMAVTNKESVRSTRLRPRLAASLLRERATEEPALLAVVDQEDILPKHRAIANAVLRSLPEACRDQLKHFYVRYDNPKNRGLAGKETMILDGNVPDDEFRALFIHEFGHIADLGCLQGTPAAGPSGFLDGKEVIYADDPSVAFYRISWLAASVQRSDAQPEDFVTGYAAWDVFEDLAESVAYYVLQRDAFEKRAGENEIIAAKLAWIQTYLFPDTAKTWAEGRHDWSGTVPWDATKLPYVWAGNADR